MKLLSLLIALSLISSPCYAISTPARVAIITSGAAGAVAANNARQQREEEERRYCQTQGWRKEYYQCRNKPWGIGEYQQQRMGDCTMRLYNNQQRCKEVLK